MILDQPIKTVFDLVMFFLGRFRSPEPLRQGHEKLRELEELMTGAGYFSEDFDVHAGLGLGLGDLLDAEGEGGGGLPIANQNEVGGGGGQPKKEVKEKFPAIDGNLSAAKLVDTYKKSLLSQQRAYKELAEKWAETSPKTGKKLVFA